MDKSTLRIITSLLHNINSFQNVTGFEIENITMNIKQVKIHFYTIN